MELEYYKVDKKVKQRVYDCPYNEGCSCAKMNCYRCGWNPIVDKIRREKILGVNREVTANG